MKLTIVSPERRVLDQAPATEVTLTTTEGQVQILPGHAPMMGGVETGRVSYRLSGASNDAVEEAVVTYGFFEVKPTDSAGDEEVVLVAETFEFRREIDRERAKRAQAKAEAALRDSSLEGKDFLKHQLKLQRALIRQQTATE